MAFLRNFPNQFVGSGIAVTTSTESAFSFGFNANFIRVVNDKAARVYVDLTTGSSGIGTTGGILTCASEVLEIRHMLAAGISFASTTTTTGTLVRVSALGA